MTGTNPGILFSEYTRRVVSFDPDTTNCEQLDQARLVTESWWPVYVRWSANGENSRRVPGVRHTSKYNDYVNTCTSKTTKHLNMLAMRHCEVVAIWTELDCIHTLLEVKMIQNQPTTAIALVVEMTQHKNSNRKLINKARPSMSMDRSRRESWESASLWILFLFSKGSV